LASETTRVTDPRVAAYADLLLDYSIGVQPGWQVLVATTTEARPLAEELSRGLARRGAYALPRVHFGGLYPLDVAATAAAPELGLPPLELEVIERMDAGIFVLAPSDPPADDQVSPEALRSFRTQFSAYRRRGRSGEMPEVRCDFPTSYFARLAELSLAEFEEVFYAACLRDWEAEGRRMRPVLERFDRAGEVRIVGAGTDLTLGLDGRKGKIDDGHQNVPGGEVFFCPVEDSAEGVIAFDWPPVRLVLHGGEVVEADGDERIHTALETDAGARRFGELGLGCNEGITRRLGSVLFDEKMAGTVHLALGAGFASIGGRNESSLHWDLVKDMRPRGELSCDGEVVQRDGRWLLA
jgi:aminopeptidase